VIFSKIVLVKQRINLQKKIKQMTGSSLGLKRKCKPNKVQFQSKRRKGKDIFTQKNKKDNKWSV